MSALHQALSKLDYVVQKLEHSMQGFEQAVVEHQPDMFGDSPSNENAGQNGGMVSRAEVTQRLDSAIQKVEQIMAESA